MNLKVFTCLIILLIKMPAADLNENISLVSKLNNLTDSELSMFLSLGPDDGEWTHRIFFAEFDNKIVYHKKDLSIFRKLNKRGLLNGLDNVESTLEYYNTKEYSDSIIIVEDIRYEDVICEFSIMLSSVGIECYKQCLQLIKSKAIKN